MSIKLIKGQRDKGQFSQFIFLVFYDLLGLKKPNKEINKRTIPSIDRIVPCPLSLYPFVANLEMDFMQNVFDDERFVISSVTGQYCQYCRFVENHIRSVQEITSILTGCFFEMGMEAKLAEPVFGKSVFF